MLNGIGEYISLSLTILLSILLRAEDYGFTSMKSVNPVNNLIEPFHFLELFGIDIEEVLLNRRVRTDSHDYHAGLLILITFTIDFLQHLISRLDDGDAGAGRRNKTLLQEIPVLWQVFPESICVQENTIQYCGKSSRKAFVFRKTPTMEATVFCILNFSAQRAA